MHNKCRENCKEKYMKLIEKIISRMMAIIMVFGMVVGMFATSVAAIPLLEDPVTLLVNSDAVDDTAIRAEEATYKTFQGAYNKALNGDTIKLETDFISHVGFGIYKSINLDLNGNKLIGPTAGPVIELRTFGTNTGSIEIKDTSIDKEGIITSTYTGFSNLIQNYGTGLVKISSGKIHSSFGRAIYSENGVLEIAGGTISSRDHSAITVGGPGNIIVSGGEILSEVNNAILVFGTGSIIMTDGLISSKKSAISGGSIPFGYRRNIEVSGGTISSTDEFSIYDGFSSSIISGGNLLSGVNLKSQDSTATISGNPSTKIILYKYSNEITIAGELTGDVKSIKIDGTNLEAATEGFVIASAASEDYVDISKFELLNLPNMMLVKSGSNIILVSVTDVDMIAEAKTAIEIALANLEVSNSTSAEQMLNAASDATLHGVIVEWDITNAFNKVDATSSAAGFLTGTFTLTLNDVQESVVLNKVIEKLPLSDAEKIAEAKTTIETALVNFEVSNSTSAEQLLNAASDATLYGVIVEWDSINGFDKVDATSSAAGLISGTLTIRLNDVQASVVLNRVIEQLPLDEIDTIEVLKNASTGIKVEGINGTVFDLKTELVVTPIMEILSKDTMDRFAIGVSGLENDLQLLELYDIKLMLDGVNIQPNGMVKVTLPLSENLLDYTNLQIVFINEEGTVTRILSNIDNNTITFTTNHFSYYGIIGTPVSSLIPDTSNPSNNFVWWIMLLGSSLVVASKKKKNMQTKIDE